MAHLISRPEIGLQSNSCLVIFLPAVSLVVRWGNGGGVFSTSPCRTKSELLVAFLSILNNLILAGKNAVNCCRPYYHWSISAREIFFWSRDSWELATLIVSCLGELIRIGWSCTLHGKMCTFQKKGLCVCVCEEGGENKSWIHWQEIALGLLEWNSFQFNVMHHWWYPCSPMRLSPVFEPKKKKTTFVFHSYVKSFSNHCWASTRIYQVITLSWLNSYPNIRFLFLFFFCFFYPVTCDHNVKDCYWSWRLGFWLQSLFSYHTWSIGIVILIQRAEYNFLPRITTILAINVEEQMENVDCCHKWYWLEH